jgi:hypothetical protein
MNEEQKPITELEAPAEPDYEKIFLAEDFKDTCLIIFKATAQGGPIQLEIFGGLGTARIAKSGGIHEFIRTNGRAVEVDGHDVLWAEHVTAKEHRQRAIERAKSAGAELEAKAAEEKAAREKAEAEAKAAQETPVKTRKGILARFKSGRRY